MNTMVLGKAEASYRRIHDRLWRSLLAYSGDPEVASDAESEAFSQCLRRADEIDNVDAWVWKASFRIAAGLLKKRSQTVMRANPATKGTYLDSSLHEFLCQLNGLSDQQRAIVALRYIGDYRPTEIAELIGSSPGSVRVQLHRAHDHLRTVLGELK
ncbi:MAG: sigma-70 family RNA polymerase sigma factor [Acidimicrobiia bacterium]|nr:sigma-70 family RNA polymerase sigma factor [Acidimicrobiia bacterium]